MGIPSYNRQHSDDFFSSPTQRRHFLIDIDVNLLQIGPLLLLLLLLLAKFSAAQVLQIKLKSKGLTGRVCPVTYRGNANSIIRPPLLCSLQTKAISSPVIQLLGLQSIPFLQRAGRKWRSTDKRMNSVRSVQRPFAAGSHNVAISPLLPS